MRKDPTHNPRLAPALARGQRQPDASRRQKSSPASTCTLDEMPDFLHQVEEPQEQARARRSERERRAEVERAKLKSKLKPRLEPLPTSVHEQPAHQGQPTRHEHRRLASEIGRASAALVRHARTAMEAEDSRR